jgi:hypothetical protein
MTAVTLLDAKQVAARLGRTQHWVNDQAKRGVIPAKKVGRYWKFTEEGIAAYLERVDNQSRDPMAMSAASASRRRVL